MKNKHFSFDDSYIQDVLAFKFSFVKPNNQNLNDRHFKLFRLFVDGEFDSDRMDYLLRDSYFCGVPYGNFDLIRLLDGLYVLEKVQSGNLELGVKKSSLSAFEDFLFARFQMHSQIYSHRVDGAFNSALTVLIKKNGDSLPPEIHKYIELDDESFLTSKHIKPPPEMLRELLLNRQMWVLVYETNENSDEIHKKVESEIKSQLTEGIVSLNKSKREFRKPEILNLPIVLKNSKDMLFTEELSRIALIIDSYQKTFFTRRVFVHPDYKDKAFEIVDRIRDTEIAEISKNTITELDETEKALNKINNQDAKNKEEVKKLTNSGK